MNTWPDGAMTPFRSEKNTNWEGAFRVPCLVRWPGAHQAGHGHQRADEPQRLDSDALRDRRRAGHRRQAARRATRPTASNYKVHLDGFDQSKFLTTVEGTVGKNNGAKSARDRFFYTDDDGELVAYRKGDYKYVSKSSGRPARCGVGRAVHEAASAEDLQPVPGSVRAGRHHVEHVLGLAAQPRAHRCTA